MNEEGDRLRVRNSSTFGLEIYTSPKPTFAMLYSDWSNADFIQGKKLLVCAVVIGRRYHCQEPLRENSGVKHGYDSHVFENRYVAFHASQLLPLYVLHVTGPHSLNSAIAWQEIQDKTG
jgi:hypothetical protein